jgi:hypothetical protein
MTTKIYSHVHTPTPTHARARAHTHTHTHTAHTYRWQVMMNMQQRGEDTKQEGHHTARRCGHQRCQCTLRRRNSHPLKRFLPPSDRILYERRTRHGFFYENKLFFQTAFTARCVACVGEFEAQESCSNEFATGEGSRASWQGYLRRPYAALLLRTQPVAA